MTDATRSIGILTGSRKGKVERVSPVFRGGVVVVVFEFEDDLTGKEVGGSE